MPSQPDREVNDLIMQPELKRVYELQVWALIREALRLSHLHISESCSYDRMRGKRAQAAIEAAMPHLPKESA